MTLKEFDDVDTIMTPMLFGLPRQYCHLDLLKAAFTADVDVLLPSLYYACADHPVSVILLEAGNLELGRKCVNTLLEGREMLEEQTHCEASGQAVARTRGLRVRKLGQVILPQASPIERHGTVR